MGGLGWPSKPMRKIVTTHVFDGHFQIIPHLRRCGLLGNPIRDDSRVGGPEGEGTGEAGIQ
jgi:hypothetical protein